MLLGLLQLFLQFPGEFPHPGNGLQDLGMLLRPALEFRCFSPLRWRLVAIMAFYA